MKKFVCTLSDISPDSYEDIVRRISVMFDTFRRIDENTLADGDITIGFQYNNADKTAEIQSDADIPDEIVEGCKADIGRNFTKSEETAEKRPNIFGNAGFFGISAVFAAAVFGIIIIDTALMYGALLLNESLKTALKNLSLQRGEMSRRRYLTELLALFNAEGFDLTLKELDMLLLLRKKTDQMLLEQTENEA